MDASGSEPTAIPGSEPTATPGIEHATWLSESCLLLVGNVAGANGTPAPDVFLISGERAIALGSQYLPAPAGDGRRRGASAEDRGTAMGALVVVLAPHADRDLDPQAALAIQTGGHALRLTAADLASLSEDTRTVLRAAFAPLDPSARSVALEFLAGALDVAPRSERATLSDSLHSVREALRERLPPSPASRTGRGGIHIDRLMALDDRAFYVQGWTHEQSGVVRLTAVSPEGARAELIDRLLRYSRPEIAGDLRGRPEADEKLGFICFFELEASSLRSDGWVFELGQERGIAHEVDAPPVRRNAADVKDALLLDPFVNGPPNEELMSSHVFPAMRRLQRRLESSRDAEVATVEQFGTPPEAPEISIVVPLYQQIQHVELQLSQFADDPELFRSDLVYVLDSPEQRDELLSYAAELHQIYRVPFRIAALSRNTGFANASNAGGRLAHGRLLLLLNSDVLPDRPGWLSKLRDFYDATPDIGALGPKLLYEDDSIQHAGMYFHSQPGSSRWIDAHFFKGMHRSLPAANVTRAVPALTAACLMIERGLYDQLGGLSGVYVQGDYEDFDLCLQLLEKGRQNWFLPDVELYHLEGQSYSPNVRRPANRYNMWLHNHRWGERIARLMAGQPAAGESR